MKITKRAQQAQRFQQPFRTELPNLDSSANDPSPIFGHLGKNPI